MEMVAASKMRRAQQRVLASRPYADRLEEMIGDLAFLQRDQEEIARFPLLDKRPIQKIELIVITSDKGLKGPLNTNIIRRATRFVLNEAEAPVQMVTIGRKGRDFMVRTRQEVVAEFTGMTDNMGLQELRPITQLVIDDFVSKRVDAVYIVFPKFVNTLAQVPEVQQLLPIVPKEGQGQYNDYIFEPSPVEVLQSLLPRAVETQLYQAMLETFASEHSAQMVAMRNASQNARDLVDDLTLTYNKARQAQITQEVSEIAAGANALQ